MALPVFVASGADINVVSSGGTSNVPVPAGVVLDDFVFLVVMGGNAASNTITAAGFTLIDSVAAGSFQSGLYLYYRWATASEPSTYPVTQSGGNIGRARMYAWRGVNKTGTINANIKSAVQNGVTSVTLTNITTTVADALEIGVSFEYNGRTPTITAGSGQTSRGGSTAGGLVFLVSEKGFPTAGLISGETHSSSVSGDFYSFSIALAPAGGGDTTPPTLTSPTGSATGSTTATVGATTNEANGTMYSIVSTSATPPSVAQIQAGQTAAGAAAPWSGNQAISGTGAKTFSATGLAASTTYYTHVQQKDAAGNDSTVVTSAGFTTSASDTTPPTLTSPTGSATGSTSGSGSVVTDEANGTLYFLATTNATETGATVKASGATQAISSTGTKSVTFSGLSPSTTYYAHYVHRDAAGNDSTRVSSSSFTTSAGSTGTIVGEVIKNPSGAPMATTTIPKVVFKRVSDMVDVLSLTSQTTDSSGLLPISNVALVAGVDYLRILCDATGANVGIKKFTAT